MINPQFQSSCDERILCDIMRQIVWQSDIDARKMRVAVSDGFVHLLGEVETCMEKVEAEKAAKAVFGVTGVVNLLDVAPFYLRSDREIAHDIDAAFRNTTSVLDERPHIVVQNGVATLRGRCRWEFQRQCAERTALATSGVKRVVNLMEVDSATMPVMISDLRLQRAS